MEPLQPCHNSNDDGDYEAEFQEELRRARKLLKVKPAKRVALCRHIKTNGEFCGSPALRGRPYCYFHLTYIGRRLRAERQARAQTSPEDAVLALHLPPFEDADSIQLSLMQVVDAILHNHIDRKRAGLVLYALQIASSNLGQGADFTAASKTAVAAGYDDFEDDYELGDEVPELTTDADEDEELDEEHETTMTLEKVRDVCNAFEHAERDAWSHGQIVKDEDGTESFTCDPIQALMCSLYPTRKDWQTSGKNQEYEFEASSQRLELLPTLEAEEEPDDASPPDEEEGGAAA